jgi:hypothetical protein
MSDKPTHADELDCLRLQNAMLKRDAAIRAANDAAEAANAAIQALTEVFAGIKPKYGLGDADEINLETHEIKRVD